MSRVGSSASEEEVSRLSKEHAELLHMMEGKWASELANQQQIQRREFHDWVKKVHEDSRGASVPAYMYVLITDWSVICGC